jgi:hypothetical protein
VGFGLSNKILPFFPICHQLSPSSLNPSSFFLCSTFVTISLLLCGVVSLTPNTQPGGQGYPFLSGSSPLTCLVWEALPVAYATASIALGIMWPHKPHHYVKLGIPSGGIRNNTYLKLDKSILRKMCEHVRDKETGGRRKLHDVLYNSSSSSYDIRVMKWRICCEPDLAYAWGDEKYNSWLESVKERSPNTSMNCVRILNFVIRKRTVLVQPLVR